MISTRVDLTEHSDFAGSWETEDQSKPLYPWTVMRKIESDWYDIRNDGDDGDLCDSTLDRRAKMPWVRLSNCRGIPWGKGQPIVTSLQRPFTPQDLFGLR